MSDGCFPHIPGEIWRQVQNHSTFTFVHKVNTFPNYSRLNSYTSKHKDTQCVVPHAQFFHDFPTLWISDMLDAGLLNVHWIQGYKGDRADPSSIKGVRVQVIVKASEPLRCSFFQYLSFSIHKEAEILLQMLHAQCRARNRLNHRCCMNLYESLYCIPTIKNWDNLQYKKNEKWVVLVTCNGSKWAVQRKSQRGAATSYLPVTGKIERRTEEPAVATKGTVLSYIVTKNV